MVNLYAYGMKHNVSYNLYAIAFYEIDRRHTAGRILYAYK